MAISFQSCVAMSSSVAADHFQDRGLCAEVYPWCRSCLSTGTMHTEESVELEGRPPLRPVSTGCVELPGVRTSIDQRSFTFYGPTIWNSLPSALRDGSLSLNTFGRHLKNSHLFKQS